MIIKIIYTAILGISSTGIIYHWDREIINNSESFLRLGKYIYI